MLNFSPYMTCLTYRALVFKKNLPNFLKHLSSSLAYTVLHTDLLRSFHFQKLLNKSFFVMPYPFLHLRKHKRKYFCYFYLFLKTSQKYLSFCYFHFFVKTSQKIFCETWSSELLQGVSFTFGHFVMDRISFTYFH